MMSKSNDSVHKGGRVKQEECAELTCSKAERRSVDYRPICPSKLSKRELEDLYFGLLNHNMELKRAVNKQQEKIKTLSTRLQRASVSQQQQRSSLQPQKECCTTAKAQIIEQGESIGDLRRANERLSERVRQLNTKLCSARQFLRRQSRPPQDHRASIKNLSSGALPASKSDNDNNVRSVSSQYVDKEAPMSTRRSIETDTSDFRIQVPVKLCDENKCRTQMEELKQKIVNLEDELTRAHVEYTDRISRLESEVRGLSATGELQARRSRADLYDAEARLRGADHRVDDLEIKLQMERNKVLELETQMKSALMGNKVSRAIGEHHVKKVKDKEVDKHRIGSGVRGSGVSGVAGGRAPRPASASPRAHTPVTRASKMQRESKSAREHDKKFQSPHLSFDASTKTRHGPPAKATTQGTLMQAQCSCDISVAGSHMTGSRENVCQCAKVAAQKPPAPQQVKQPEIKELVSKQTEGTQKAECWCRHELERAVREAAKKKSGVICECKESCVPTPPVETPKTTPPVTPHKKAETCILCELCGKPLFDQSGPRQRKPSPNLNQSAPSYDESGRQGTQSYQIVAATQYSSPKQGQNVTETVTVSKDIAADRPRRLSMRPRPNQTQATAASAVVVSQSPPPSTPRITPPLLASLNTPLDSVQTKVDVATGETYMTMQDDLRVSSDMMPARPFPDMESKASEDSARHDPIKYVDKKLLKANEVMLDKIAWLEEEVKNLRSAAAVSRYADNAIDHSDGSRNASASTSKEAKNTSVSVSVSPSPADQAIEPVKLNSMKDSSSAKEIEKTRTLDEANKRWGEYEEATKSSLTKGAQEMRAEEHKFTTQQGIGMFSSDYVKRKRYDSHLKGHGTRGKEDNDSFTIIDKQDAQIKDSIQIPVDKNVVDKEFDAAAINNKVRDIDKSHSDENLDMVSLDPLFNKNDELDVKLQKSITRFLTVAELTRSASKTHLSPTMSKIQDPPSPNRSVSQHILNYSKGSGAEQLESKTQESQTKHGVYSTAQTEAGTQELDICEQHAHVCTCPPAVRASAAMFRSCSGTHRFAANESRFRHCMCCMPADVGVQATLCGGNILNQCAQKPRADGCCQADDTTTGWAKGERKAQWTDTGAKAKLYNTSDDQMPCRDTGIENCTPATPQIPTSQITAPPHNSSTAFTILKKYTIKGSADVVKYDPEVAENTEELISSMTDLPTEKDTTTTTSYDYRRSTAAPEAESTPLAPRYAPDYCSLSEGEIPDETMGISGKSVEEEEGRAKSDTNQSAGTGNEMEAALLAVTGELEKCRRLLGAAASKKKDASSMVERPSSSIPLRKVSGKQRIGDTYTPKCIFTLHIGTVVLSDEAVINSREMSLMLTWQFYDQNVAMTRMRAGRVVHFDFSTEYDIRLTDDFLEYMKHEEMPIVISELNKTEPFASCSLPLRDALLHTNRRADMSLALMAGPASAVTDKVVADDLDSGDELGVLDLWCSLRAEPRLLPSINTAIAKTPSQSQRGSGPGAAILAQINEDDLDEYHLTDLELASKPYDFHPKLSISEDPQPQKPLISLGRCRKVSTVSPAPLPAAQPAPPEPAEPPEVPDAIAEYTTELNAPEYTKGQVSFDDKCGRIASGIIVNEVQANIKSKGEMNKALYQKSMNMAGVSRKDDIQTTNMLSISNLARSSRAGKERKRLSLTPVMNPSLSYDSQARRMPKDLANEMFDPSDQGRRMSILTGKSGSETPREAMREESSSTVGSKKFDMSKLVGTKKAIEAFRRVKIKQKSQQQPPENNVETHDENEKSYLDKLGAHTIDITIQWLALNEECDAMTDPNVQRLYVAYSFLGRNGAELETPVSLPKPKQYVDKCFFDFKKTFQLSECEMSQLARLGRHRAPAKGAANPKECVVFTVVSEPAEDPLALHDCEDIGYAYLYLGELLAFSAGSDTYTEVVPVRDARDPRAVCGVLAVRKLPRNHAPSLK